MIKPHSSRNILIRSILLLGVILTLALGITSSTTAQTDGDNLKEVHTVDTNDFGLLNPAGVAFSPAANLFFVIEADTSPETKITMVTPLEESAGVVNLNISMNDPVNMAFDGWGNRLLLYDTTSSELVEVNATPDGALDPATSTINRRFKAGPYGLHDPQGMAINPANGQLFILDSSAGRLVRIQPDSQGDLNAEAAQNEGRVTYIDLQVTGLVDPHGLAFNVSTGHLYIFSPSQKKLFEITTSGVEVASFGTAGTILNDPQAMVFAPSANSTDDPSIIHLFMADTGFRSGTTGSPASADPSTVSGFEIYLPLIFGNGVQDAGPELGRIIELSLPMLPIPQIRETIDYEAHSIDTNELGLLNPAGLAFSAKANLFFVMEADSQTKIRITQMTPFERSAGTVEIDNLENSPINMTYDPLGNRLLLLNPTANELLEIKVGPDGAFDSGSKSINRRFKTKEYNLKNPQGLSVDSTNGHLVILDKGARQFIRIEPDSGGGFEDETALSEGRVSEISLDPIDAVDAQGMAINPANGHYYHLSLSGKKLYETTATGEKVASYDLSASNLVDPQAMVFAPSTDATDDPTKINLFLADSGLKPGNQEKGRPLGRIIELDLNTSLEANAAELGTLAVTDQATLVRTTDTSAYNPPSPDPSGVVYLPNSDSLLIGDGEVNEMTIFTDENVFETNLTGGLLATYVTFHSGDSPVNDEPTGMAFNPFNNHIFISDDTGDRWVFEVDLGPDGIFDTPDDTRTFIVTANFGSNDPEGITYDTWQGHLFIVDGVNEEVYDVNPGANGLFDGVPPIGDDQVTNFDTTALGLRDPEGIAFDTDNGHLYILSSRETYIAETTREGTLLRYIDISSLNSIKAAGLAYAPASGNPAGRHLYIVDRAVDNNADPNENDGKLYEISYPLMPGSGNEPPIVDAGGDQSITLPDNATLDGSVSDDGEPNPPGAVTTTWSMVSGPGSVTFADANAVDTTASFSAAGTYVLQLSASDGQLVANDQVSITALSSSGTIVLDVRVSAGADDAEENISGSVSFNNSDLELVYTGGGNQTVGMRFGGLTIPQGSTISSAFVQFQADETDSGATLLSVQGQAADNAPSFTSDAFSISTRPRTSAAIGWAPPPWTTVGESGPDQRTPNIAPVIEEIVGRSGWASGNALVVIITGEGTRTAESWNGDQLGAPLLHVEYGPPGTNEAPTVDAGADQTITLPSSASLDGTVTDDGLPTGVLTTTWSVISGPGTVTFGDANAIDTTADFSTDGSYVLRLTADDGDLISSDDITITVNPEPNVAPTVDAGTDQTITLPARASLDGTVTDDGLPTGVVTTTWSVISGPGTVTFGDVNAIDTTADFSTDGQYLLQLTADDGELTSSDDVQITVDPEPTNVAPVVDAGADQTITLPSSANLDGTVTDDGLPTGVVTTTWSVISGPGTVTFGDANAVDTTADFSTDGSYVLRLTADDGDLTSSDDITITVNPEPNVAPTVDAGVAQTVTLPGSASLDGTVTDDGLPTGVVTTTWSVISGPGTVTFGDATAIDTTADFSTDGQYLLHLTADDGELTSSDNVLVTVNPEPNVAPTVDAGADQTVTLPASASLDGTVTDDGLPTGVLTTTWSVISGPGTVTFGDATAIDTTADFSTDGQYLLHLTADDGELTSSDNVLVTVNPEPNVAPTVDAGADQTVTLPASASLDGTVTDDGLPGGVLTTTWSVISGPGTVTFGDANAVDTTADFSTDGQYLLQLTADDGELTSSDNVLVTVNPEPNVAPTVDAGADQTVTLPASASLDGTVTDDGLPTGVLTTTWSVISGPGTVTFGDANAVDTTADFSTDGQYLLHLTADDGELTSSDNVLVTVNPEPNVAPTVDAGADQTVTLPASASLDGTVTDDGLPGGVLTTTWSVISGPGTVTFGDANAVDTTADFSTDGQYLLQLTADDGELTSSDNVLVTVNPEPNVAPTVDAGADQTVTLPASASLDGTVTDDGLPGGVLTTTWSVISGPGTVTFGDANAVDTTADFSTDGQYLLQLTADDGELASSDNVLVTVNPESNTAPVVDAGVDQTITLPGSASLDGTVTDDGLPTGVVTTTWSVISGPGTVTFGDANAVDTTADFSTDGQYLLQLTADDGELASSDNVLVTVNPESNTAPVVDAGVDQTITLPGSASLDGTVTDDGLPTGVVTTTWSVISGPGTVTFGDVNAVDTTASFSTDGQYLLQLTADDGELTSSDNVLVTVNPEPNVAPTVDAGADQTVTLPASASLDGTVTDDGLPGGVLTTTWSVISGPGTVTFGDANAVDTTADFSTDGQYLLQLTADDGELASSDNVLVTVNPESNTAPVVDAGVDQTVTLPGSASLDGTVTDDGLPTGVVTTTWSVISGPGTVTFGDANAVDTTADFSTDGSYVLRLTADDGDLTSSDDVQITVDPEPNTAPVVDAGTDQTITLPSSASLDGTVTDDGLPTGVVTTTWSVISGPGTVTFGDATAIDTTANFSTDGQYLLQLTADDGELASSDNVLVTVNPESNTAPVVDAGVDQTVTLPGSASLDGTVTDDGLPTGVVTTTWSVISGPGTVTFGDANAVDTTADFSTDGSYVLRLTADDGDLTSSDDVQITVDPEPNTAPVVDAGTDQTITLPSSASLDGTVTDDGLPTGVVTTTWSVISGPGTVTFGDATAIDTTANFSTDGQYLLQLTADDGELASSDDVQITVEPEQVVNGVVDVRVGASSDDAEEESGDVDLDSSDLELVFDDSDQTVGLRFNGVDIPQGATISSAYVQFQVDETGSDPTSLTIQGEATNNAGTFTTATSNISSRSRTTAAVSWSPAAWTTKGEAGPDQQTPDLASVIQEIVDRSGWASGNSLAIIITGTGERTAESYNGSQSGAPLLHVEYSTSNQNRPSVDAGPDQTITSPDSATLDGSVSDDGLPNPPGAVTTTWNKVSGPGTVAFRDANAVDTTASFSEPGIYVLRLTADDGELNGKDETIITVLGPAGAIIIEVRVVAGSDDAEESASGSIDRGSSDLELTFDDSDQTVGIRFNGVNIPQGATISSAYIQFQVDETGSDPTSLTIQGQAADNATTFTTATSNISSRPRTTAAVPWSPVAWTTKGEAGADQQTPDLASVIQEVVNRPGWSSGNSLAIVITGTGERTAESFNGNQSGAPLLHVEYSSGN